jgi:hypothetical protein
MKEKEEEEEEVEEEEVTFPEEEIYEEVREKYSKEGSQERLQPVFVICWIYLIFSLLVLNKLALFRATKF